MRQIMAAAIVTRDAPCHLALLRLHAYMSENNARVFQEAFIAVSHLTSLNTGHTGSR